MSLACSSIRPECWWDVPSPAISWWRFALRPSGCGARCRGCRPDIRSILLLSRAPRPGCRRKYPRGQNPECYGLRSCCLMRAAASVVSPSPKEAFENRAWIDFHRIRCCGGAPRDRIGVGAAITCIAISSESGFFQADFERTELGDFPKFLGRNLISRNAGSNVGAFSSLGVNTGEPSGAARARDRPLRLLTHGHSIEPGCSGPEPSRGGVLATSWWGKRKTGSLLGREPALLDNSIGSVNKSQAHGWISRRQAGQSSSWDHCVQQRKSESRAQTT